MINQSSQPKPNQNRQTQPARRPKRHYWAPRPIRLFRGDRPSPYLIQWGHREHRKTESYRTLEEREARYQELVEQLAQEREECVLSRGEIQDFLAFRRAIGEATWVDVVAGWRENNERTGKTASTLTVAQAVKSYLETFEARQKRGEVTANSLRQRRHKLQMFTEKFGDRLMNSITAPEIEGWIDSFGWTSAGTFNSYRKHICALFNKYRKDVPINPTDSFSKRNDSIDEVGILTPGETARLFACAKQHYPEALGRLALEAFAGLRFSSSCRLSKSDINFVEKGILLPKNKIKTKRRFYLDGLPPNLWEWLAATNDACWAMNEAEWMHLKSKLFREAKVRHPRNCLRHSFCTYHVAAFKNPGLTATLLCHRNQDKLWDHYYGISNQPTGMAYFNIIPSNVDKLVAEE